MASERLGQFYQDGMDIAVRYGQPPFGAGLNATLLFRYELIAVASPSLLVQHGAPQFASDSLPYTLLHDGHDLWPQFLAQAFPDGMPATPANLLFNQTALAIDAALGGQGIALTSPHFVKSELATGRLTQAFPARLTVNAGWFWFLLANRASMRRWTLLGTGCSTKPKFRMASDALQTAFNTAP